jgi:replicative DNA helicase
MIYYAAKRQQVETGLVAVIIDYVQLIRDSTRYESEAVKYSNIAHDLKDMARDLDVPVIEVSQYARGTADDNHKYKGSSAWEQDASWLLHYSIETDRDGAERTYISIGGIRQRGAISTGKVEIEYNMLQQRFTEIG